MQHFLTTFIWLAVWLAIVVLMLCICGALYMVADAVWKGDWHTAGARVGIVFALMIAASALISAVDRRM